ncbi:MAG: hypothetical protein AAFX10_00040 [Pseudomonadota bacterium]
MEAEHRDAHDEEDTRCGAGEGFNAARDDVADQAAIHLGFVSRDDGFASSDLTDQHSFDNALATVRAWRVN